MNRYRFWILFAVLAALGLASCVKTPKQQLQGRWYNETNSIRFNPDGTLFWNAQQGQATGTYNYNGSVRVSSTNEPAYNLAMDLMTSGQAIQTRFEVEFLGGRRLRLLQTSPSSNLIPKRLLVLKRAEDDATGAESDATATVQGRPLVPAPRRPRSGG